MSLIRNWLTQEVSGWSRQHLTFAVSGGRCHFTFILSASFSLPVLIVLFPRMNWFLYITGSYLPGPSAILIIHCHLQSSQFRVICVVNFSAVFFYQIINEDKTFNWIEFCCFTVISGKFHGDWLLFPVMICKSNMVSLFGHLFPNIFSLSFCSFKFNFSQRLH